ncbi:F-box associated domain containing protein [Tanacetum coccineum]|uniref:F-box associated domain containing protein n=1 Tax=Tanacetum coccineum TaxID=301880 RepID=A0ABQ5CRK8_9ASTR
MKGYLEDSIRLQSNLEGLNSSLEFIQSHRKHDLESKKAVARLECSTMVEHQPDPDGELGGYKLKEMVNSLDVQASVKTLLRCKSVCKEWIRLKSCPLNDVLFDNSVNNALKYPFKSSTRSVRIVGSCNGLLCIVVQGTTFIYNPSTRILNRLYCGFNYPYWLLGFGYDVFNDDNKVVAVLDYNKVKIYSLKTGKWKNICDFPYYYLLYVPGIFSNGALHWATCTESSPNMWKIVSLNIAKEAYDEVLLPEYGEGNMHLELGALGQCLCVLCNYFKSHADLWVLKVYGVKDSWTKLASIPLLLRFAGNYVVFDSKNISFTLVKEIDGLYQACTVVESLVPPTFALGICNRLRSSCKRLSSARAVIDL